MVLGTIKQVDPARNAIQVQMVGQESQLRWVIVSGESSMTRQAQGTLADLKPNDTISVQGVATSINASQLQVGEVPQLPFGGGAFGGPRPGGGGPGAAPGGQGRPGAAGGGIRGMLGAGTTQVIGTIVSTNPLVVMLPGNVRVNVTADPSTRITKIVKTTLAELKPGETIRAMGRPDDNNNVVAMQVVVGVDLNAVGPGFGGRGGFGGGARGQRGQGQPRRRNDSL
jgi:hypothetical protein